MPYSFSSKTVFGTTLPSRRIICSNMAISRRDSGSEVSSIRTSRPIVSKAILPAVRIVPQCATRTAQQGFGPGDQLGRRKGLDEIIIGAGIQAAHPVFDRIARGE